MPTGVDFSFLSFLRYCWHTSLSKTPARGEVDLRQLLMSVLRLMSKFAYHTFDSCDSISVAGVLLKTTWTEPAMPLQHVCSCIARIWVWVSTL